MGMEMNLIENSVSSGFHWKCSPNVRSKGPKKCVSVSFSVGRWWAWSVVCTLSFHLTTGRTSQRRCPACLWVDGSRTHKPKYNWHWKSWGKTHRIKHQKSNNFESDWFYFVFSGPHRAMPLRCAMRFESNTPNRWRSLQRYQNPICYTRVIIILPQGNSRDKCCDLGLRRPFFDIKHAKCLRFRLSLRSGLRCDCVKCQVTRIPVEWYEPLRLCSSPAVGECLEKGQSVKRSSLHKFVGFLLICHSPQPTFPAYKIFSLNWNPSSSNNVFDIIVIFNATISKEFWQWCTKNQQQQSSSPCDVVSPQLKTVFLHCRSKTTRKSDAVPPKLGTEMLEIQEKLAYIVARDLLWKAVFPLMQSHLKSQSVHAGDSRGAG